MVQTLPERLNRIRRRVRRTLLIHGVCWVSSVLAASLLCAGLFDWMLHFDDPGIRLFVSVGILGLTLWAVYRFLVTPLSVPMSDIDIALRIETRYPGLKGSLSSTVQFLKQGTNPRLGSPVLQKQVIRDTLARVHRMDIGNIVDLRSTRRVRLLTLFVVASASLIAGLNRAEAATALHRMLLPFSNRPWPRNTELRLVNAELQPVRVDPNQPFRVVRGESVELFIRNDRGALPSDVRFEYRLPSAAPAVEGIRRAMLRDEAGHSVEVGLLLLSSERGSMAFRCVGGDDDRMPWYHVQVVQPPEVTELQVTLEPPAYSTWPRELLSPGVGHVQGLVGTRVEIEAACNSPLTSAALCIQNREPAPLKSSADGRHFTAVFQINQPGSSAYWFDLTDAHGFQNPRPARYEIRGIPDLEPSVVIEYPDADGNVTADAVVLIAAAAQDDLGLKDVRLQYVVESSNGLPSIETSVPLFVHDPAKPLKQKSVEFQWRLSEIPVAAGMRVRYRIEAGDYYDLGPAHVGRSASHTLTVVSAQQKGQELVATQYGVVEELERTLASQRQAREQVGDLKTQWERVGQLQRADVDLLHRTELDQQRISAELTNPVDGMQDRARGLLREFRENHIDDPASTRQLERLAVELDRLGREHLPQIQQNLTSAAKGLQTADRVENKPSTESRRESTSQAPHKGSAVATGGSTGASEVSESLASAKNHQTSVIESMDELLSDLGNWRDRRNLIYELDGIAAQQQNVTEGTSHVAQNTLTKTLAELSEQQQTDLDKLADRQRALAEQLERFRQGLGDVERKLAQTDADSADLVAEASEQLDQRASVGHMREISRQLAGNSVGQAARGQQQLGEDLQTLGQILRNRPVSDTETLTKKLKQAERDMDSLRKRQQALLSQVGDADQIVDAAARHAELESLRQRQQKLAEQAERMRREVARLQSRSSGESVGRAVDRMRQAETGLHADQATEARRNQQEALDDLEQAQRELADTRRRAEEQLAQELLEGIDDVLGAMIDRQTTIIEETHRLDAAFRLRGNWSRAQLKTLRDLVDEQRGLEQETDHLGQKFSAVEVFALALKGAAQRMRSAANRLAERKTDEVTIDYEAAAARRFTDLLDALKPDPQQPETPGDAAETAVGKANSAARANYSPSVAELKMLKALQVELKQRTSRLAASIGDRAELTPDEQSELQAVALEQGQLGDLARNLMPAVAPVTNSEDPAVPPDER